LLTQIKFVPYPKTCQHWSIFVRVKSKSILEDVEENAAIVLRVP